MKRSLIPRAKRGEIPDRIEPQLATLRPQPPAGSEWIHEIKFDGYRMACKLEKGKVSLQSRTALNWTKRLPELVADLSRLPDKSAWLDGEIAALRPDGMSDFNLLQNSFRNRETGRLAFSVFDLLHVDGFDLRACALSDRKGILATVVDGATSRIRFVEHVADLGRDFFAECRRLGLEAPCRKERTADIARPEVPTGSTVQATRESRDRRVLGPAVASRGTWSALAGKLRARG